MLTERLRRLRGRTPAGFAVCSAAAGTDLLFIEAALAQDCPAQVHVVLPWEEEAFLASSVNYGGDFWVEKFRALRARATSVTTLTQRTLPQLGQSFPLGKAGLGLEYCNECIAGLALQRGRALGAEVRPLALSDGQPADGPGGTESFIAFWQERLGLPVEIITLKPLRAEGSGPRFAFKPDTPRPNPMARTDISVNRGHSAIKTMLFADVAGYSKITEEQTANFAPVFLGAVSELIAKSGDGKPVLSNTWGDALHMVFDEPEHGGNFALQLASMIRAGKPWRSGNLLPANLSVRIALHTGPVLLCVDPVIRQMTFTGNHVSHAARIEPVVARGEVYASEAFVAYAEIARHRLQGEWAPFICDYLGLKDLAKKLRTVPLVSSAILLALKPARNPEFRQN